MWPVTRDISTSCLLLLLTLSVSSGAFPGDKGSGTLTDKSEALAEELPAFGLNRDLRAENSTADSSTSHKRQNTTLAGTSTADNSISDTNRNISSTGNSTNATLRHETSVETAAMNILRGLAKTRSTVLTNQSIVFTGQHPDGEDVLRKILSMNAAHLRQAVSDSLLFLSRSRSVTKNKQPRPEADSQYQLCIDHMAHFAERLAMKEPWALALVDSMGRPGPGVSQGNLRWPGSYRMCIEFKAYVHRCVLFRGSYCNVFPTYLSETKGIRQHLLPKFVDESDYTQMYVGMCLPDTCSETHMEIFINEIIGRLNETTNFSVECIHPESTLDTKACVAIGIFGVLAFFILLGTLVDVYLMMKPRGQDGSGDSIDKVPITSADDAKENMRQLSSLNSFKGVIVKTLLAFSVYSNGAKMLSTVQKEGALTCVHGINYLSMTWILLGNSFSLPRMIGVNIKPFWESTRHNPTFNIVLNSVLAVDTFLVISGLLVCYLTLKELKKNDGKLNWFFFCFHRFWRLTPTYMLVMLVYVCLSRYVPRGQLWYPSIPDRDNCGAHGWTNLLYINNFLEVDQMCMFQTWYLATHMQLYCVLSPIIIILLYKLPWMGIAASIGVILANCVICGVLCYMDLFDDDMYPKPFIHMGPYVIGLLAGYFLCVRKSELNMGKPLVGVVWVVASASAIAVVMFPFYFNDVVYHTLRNTVWAACVTWVIVACVTGHGGFVNTLLSSLMFMPLNRLTNSLYLSHVMVIILELTAQHTVMYFAYNRLIYFYLAVLIASHLAAIVVAFCFETPMTSATALLEEAIFHRDVKRDVTNPEANGDDANNLEMLGGATGNVTEFY